MRVAAAAGIRRWRSIGASAGGTQTASAAGVRDFNLQVKCPGIHLEKTKLKWDDDKIMTHENVTPDEIASCERFTAAQPKGYVPPPPPGTPGAQASGGVDDDNGPEQPPRIRRWLVAMELARA